MCTKRKGDKQVACKYQLETSSTEHCNVIQSPWFFPRFKSFLLFSVAPMTSGAVTPAVATIATRTTAGAATTRPIADGEVKTEGPTAACRGAAAAAVMTWWTWRGTAGWEAEGPGAGDTTTMTASCEKPWRGRRWASSRGRAAGSGWTARATVRTGWGAPADPRRFLRTRLLGTRGDAMTFPLLRPPRTVTLKVGPLQRKATCERWVTLQPHCVLGKDYNAAWAVLMSLVLLSDLLKFPTFY